MISTLFLKQSVQPESELSPLLDDPKTPLVARPVAAGKWVPQNGPRFQIQTGARTTYTSHTRTTEEKSGKKRGGREGETGRFNVHFIPYVLCRFRSQVHRRNCDTLSRFKGQNSKRIPPCTSRTNVARRTDVRTT